MPRTPPAPRKHVDRVLLLRRTQFGESSLVVQGLGRRAGRVHLLAKGAYRATSRFAHVLDLGDTLELEWTARPGQELATLVAGSLVLRRRRLGSASEVWRAATTALELVDIAARPGAPDPGLFDLLAETLDRLEVGAPPELTLVVFELGFLAHLGLAPALLACATCGVPLTPHVSADGGARVHFSAGAGGTLCAVHAAEARASGRRVGTLPLDVLAAADRWCREPFRATVAADPPHALVERVRDFVGRFLDYHLESRLKSHRAFLAAPDRNRRPGAASAPLPAPTEAPPRRESP